MSTRSSVDRTLTCDDKSGCGREFTVPDSRLPEDAGTFVLVREMAATNGWQVGVLPADPLALRQYDYCPAHRTDGFAREQAEADGWDLPPTQALILEVLAARYRGGDLTWPFPAKAEHALQALQLRGLVSFQRGPQPRSYAAQLTGRGRKMMLLPGYRTPLLNLLDEALHLRQHGEWAPGGKENWHAWDRKAESFLRVILGGSL